MWGSKSICPVWIYPTENFQTKKQVQVSLSMNAVIVNEMHASQQSTKEGLNEELEEDFISSKEIN